jgi:hypothetical protein
MLKFDPVSRDRMFYDQYEYGICISLEEAGCLRAKTAEELISAVQARNYARHRYGVKEQISNEQVADLTAMFGALEPFRDQLKLVISFNIMYIYSNNIPALQRLAGLQYVNFCNAVQAVVDRPRDVILKTNPKFKYRSYFKEKVLEEHERDRLMNFLESRRDVFGFTSTLKSTLNRYRVHWLPRHLYIEHNDPKDITMFSLVCPGLIRKTFAVQAK